MFEATQTLLRKRTPLTSLYDSTDKFMLNKKQTSYKIKKRFQEQFADPSQLSVTPDRTSRPLRTPITADKLQLAFKRLRNGRAVGPDAIPAELLKYGTAVLAAPVAVTSTTDFNMETISTLEKEYY
ncbi:hypothetical protein L915_19869 [Phytophthora nicotianae]|uniref:Uncharacterized protein n=1 Tax=Phytophthora nicotianae TaxID=4792 RepID=W2FQT1_PHYNI|nr:hypothetical protein L915_19869 [Phytophthora nicotianae]